MSRQAGIKLTSPICLLINHIPRLNFTFLFNQGLGEIILKNTELFYCYFATKNPFITVKNVHLLWTLQLGYSIPDAF